MPKIYIVTREPFHDNSTLLGAYPSIDAAKLSVSPSPDKWSLHVNPSDNVISRYLADEGEDNYEIHEFVVIDDDVMAVVDGEATVTTLDERVLVLLFSYSPSTSVYLFSYVTHYDTREAASEFTCSLDCSRADGVPDYRGYLVPDEDAQMRANELAPEVKRALFALRSYAARLRPPIRIARTSRLAPDETVTKPPRGTFLCSTSLS